MAYRSAAARISSEARPDTISAPRVDPSGGSRSASDPGTSASPPSASASHSPVERPISSRRWAFTAIIEDDPAGRSRTAQPVASRSRRAHAIGVAISTDDSGEAKPPTPPVPVPPPAVGKTRFFGSKELQADRLATDFKKLSDEVLAPLGAVPGVDLRVTVEIEAVAPEGFDDSKIRAVSENATTLKFEESGFEE